MAQSRGLVTKQIAFYGSTPAYKPVLDSIGAGELQGELNTLSKQGRWDDMGTLIDDSLLNEFAVVAEPLALAGKLQARYGDLVDRTAAAYSNIAKEDRLAIVRELTG